MPKATFNAATNQPVEPTPSSEAQKILEYDTIYNAAFEMLEDHGPEALILTVNSLYSELRKTHDSAYPIIEDILDAGNLAIMSHNGQPDRTSKRVPLITCDILPPEDQAYNMDC